MWGALFVEMTVLLVVHIIYIYNFTCRHSTCSFVKDPVLVDTYYLQPHSAVPFRSPVYSLGADRIENTTSNSFSIVACAYPLPGIHVYKLLPGNGRLLCFCCFCVFTAPLLRNRRLLLFHYFGFQLSYHYMTSRRVA
jgi:hypothetical protein